MKFKKIELVIFHPYSMIGGADKSLSRLINNIDHNKYSYAYDVLTKTASETTNPTATQLRWFIRSFIKIATIRVIRIVDS